MKYNTVAAIALGVALGAVFLSVWALARATSTHRLAYDAYENSANHISKQIELEESTNECFRAALKADKQFAEAMDVVFSRIQAIEDKQNGINEYIDAVHGRVAP